jgi:hypothetical protein
LRSNRDDYWLGWLSTLIDAMLLIPKMDYLMRSNMFALTLIKMSLKMATAAAVSKFEIKTLFLDS